MICILIPPSIYSQFESERLEFYPIHLGDSWQFVNYHISYDFGPPDTFEVTYHLQEIVRDTLMPNGKRYFCTFIDLDYGEVYRRVDTLNLFVLEYDSTNIENNYETVIFDLSITDSSRWEDGRGYFHQIQTSLEPKKVGETDFSRIRTQYDRDIALGQSLSQGFGITSMWTGGPNVQHHYYLIWARINGIEYGEITSINENKEEYPTKYTLFQNYPNPFNNETVIKIFIYGDTEISLSIYDLQGRLVENLVNRRLQRGIHEYKWNPINQSSGVYYYQLKTEDYVSVKKCLIIK